METTRRSFVSAVLLLLVSFPSLAEQRFSVTPRTGPASGGTAVTITSNEPLGSWPYTVSFDGVGAVTEHVDERTLRAVTPPHAAGVTEVTIFEYDQFLSTGLTFTFEGDRERLLLPIFVPPVRGKFGSEFRTELHGINTAYWTVNIFGFEFDCVVSPFFCGPEDPIELAPNLTDISDYPLRYTGNPGRFIYLPARDAALFSASLRVYDTSRSAENFGTEVPIVREKDFKRQPFALVHVPLDPRLRKTLRLYSYEPATVTVEIGDQRYEMKLEGGDGKYLPAYTMFTNFPPGTGVGTYNVIVRADTARTPVWGFVSVTNNETQQITVITPH